MITFEVPDMTCGHCISAITRAVRAVDKDAGVDIDLGRHLVQIRAGDSDAQALSDAIKEAGYTPVPVPVQGGVGGDAPARQGGG